MGVDDIAVLVDDELDQHLAADPGAAHLVGIRRLRLHAGLGLLAQLVGGEDIRERFPPVGVRVRDRDDDGLRRDHSRRRRWAERLREGIDRHEGGRVGQAGRGHLLLRGNVDWIHDLLRLVLLDRRKIDDHGRILGARRMGRRRELVAPRDQGGVQGQGNDDAGEEVFGHGRVGVGPMDVGVGCHDYYAPPPDPLGRAAQFSLPPGQASGPPPGLSRHPC